VNADFNPSAKLAKVLPLLGSDKPGEVVAAVAAAHRIQKATGLSWDDLLRGPEPAEHHEPSIRTWRTARLELQRRSGSLRAWERGFVRDLPNFQRLSPKQRNCLSGIAERVLRRGE
jgi:hypothetical protein